MPNSEIRKTKIVCTIGPASDSPEVIAELLDAGMNVARINFSHGTHEEHLRKIELIRKVAKEKGVAVGILQDLSGPKIRIGKMREPVQLQKGAMFSIYSDERMGNASGASCSHKDLAAALKPGQAILLADGAIRLRVREISKTTVHTEVEVAGELSSHKGINLPESSLAIPALTEKDKRDLEFGIKCDVDIVALSFVRLPRDVMKVKSIMHRLHVDIPVFAKIEKHEAIDAIDEIIEISDGIMIARGDLAVETPLERVPVVQKMIINKCNTSGKPVITATQMLKSMVDNPRPTRAEAADVANAMLDGTDAVMLSEETAVGKYPAETVQTMHNILMEAEATQDAHWQLPVQRTRRQTDKVGIPESVSRAAVTMAYDLNARAIVTPTGSGSSARMVARFRPQRPVIALCMNKKVEAQLCVSWGVFPQSVPEMQNTDDLIALAVREARRQGHASEGDRIVITAGLPPGKPGTTNLIKVEEIN